MAATAAATNNLGFMLRIPSLAKQLAVLTISRGLEGRLNAQA
jgi:hypothetical protein